MKRFQFQRLVQHVAVTVVIVAAARLPAQETTFTVTERTDPPGLVAERTTIVTGGETHIAEIAPPIVGNSRLAFWTVNGERQTSPGGHGLFRPSFVVTSDTVAVAHYFPEGVDTDADRLEDWWEYWMFGDRTRGPLGNPDGDIFNNEHEFRTGLNATVFDEQRTGGIAARASSAIAFLAADAARYRITSQPFGLLPPLEGIKARNETVTTPYLQGDREGYTFVGWEVNGAPRVGPAGVYLNQVTVKLDEQETIIVARFIRAGDDQDGDALPDSYEWQHFATFEHDMTSNPDGDGLPIRTEFDLGLSPALPDLPQRGGIAARMSSAITFLADDAARYRITSQPFGLLPPLEGVRTSGETVTTPYLQGDRQGYTFVGWEVNGAPRVGPARVYLNQLTVKLDAGLTSIVARFVRAGADGDEDGLPDAYEWQHFATFEHDMTSNPDGDGLPIRTEFDLGLSPALPDLPQRGGIAARMSSAITFLADAAARYRITSQPFGLLPPLEGIKARNETVTTPYLQGDRQGYTFVGWEVNGAPYTGPAGVYLNQATVKLDAGLTSIVARFIRAGDDQDGDGLPDSYEWQHFATFEHDMTSNPDGDGLPIRTEFDLGLSPALPDLPQRGGIAARMSHVRTVDLDVGPTGIGITASTIEQGSAAGTLVGELVAFSTSPDEEVEFDFAGGPGAEQNALFRITTQNRLQAADSITFPVGTELSVRLEVRETGGLQRAFQQILLIQVVPNAISDFPEFAAAFFTPGQLADRSVSGLLADPDGDGLTNAQEYMHGYHPLRFENEPFKIQSISQAGGTGSPAIEFTFPWRDGMTDAEYSLERQDAPGQPWGTAEFTQVTDPPEDGIRKITLRVELGYPPPARAFFRLVTKVAP